MAGRLMFVLKFSVPTLVTQLMLHVNVGLV